MAPELTFTRGETDPLEAITSPNDADGPNGLINKRGRGTLRSVLGFGVHKALRATTMTARGAFRSVSCGGASVSEVSQPGTAR